MKEPLLPEAIARLAPGELFVNELFTSIQGESSHAGRPCFFIRLAGCHLRCAWCDTRYAFHEGTVLSVAECVSRTAASGQKLVEVTGGEPLLQQSTYELLGALCDHGFEVLLETSGSLPVDRVDRRVLRMVDWKCPASGMEAANRPEVLADLKEGDELKLVIQDKKDYEWAKAWLCGAKETGAIGPLLPVHFSPAFGRLSPGELAEWILEDRLCVRFNLQIHKHIWDPGRRGV